MYDITAFGEILIDFTYNGRNKDGRVLFAQNPGGAPANLLVAATKLGAKTAMIGKVGNDMHGQFLKEVLESAHVGTAGLVLDDRYFTTLAFVSLDENGERSFSFSRKPGADTCMTIAELDRDSLKNTKIFHVGSLSLTDEPSRGATLYAVQEAKKAGAVISYDPNYRSSLWQSEEAAKEQMRSLIPYADMMKISDEETDLLTDEHAPEAAAKVLLSKGVKLVAVTLGGDGAYLATAGSSVRIPGNQVPVVDTTGAGDSFWGGFLCQLVKSEKKPEDLREKDLEAYGRFANAVAGLCVQKKGAIPAMPSSEEVNAFLKNR